jgi:hypothetical protein
MPDRKITANPATTTTTTVVLLTEEKVFAPAYLGLASLVF